ncbi:GNAT family N-acetyltransferase [Lolliginicoccus levis]|uniref:GNAT family N-acetyltransferase n=1 Tax=Lolliginicoccus levis TaxID=2919542 RepID=UPI00241C8465|nr:GNAT family N-acetyltransferase [Lolliginicoccus levis]
MSTPFSSGQNHTALPAVDRIAALFSTLSTPARVALVHHVARTPGGIRSGEPLPHDCSRTDLHALLESGILAEHNGSIVVARDARAHASVLTDLLLGLAPVGIGSAIPPSSGDVAIRAAATSDWDAILAIYEEGIATGNATFDTRSAGADAFDGRWLPEHRWIAEREGTILGWAALSPTSVRPFFAGVLEVSIYISGATAGQGVGSRLLEHVVRHADAAGLWTLQSSIFPENMASLVLHRKAGFRTVGVRQAVARHHDHWRDTVIVERRSPTAW